MFKRYIYIIVILLQPYLLLSQGDFKNPIEYAKQANKLFENNDFQAAYPFYQTLRSNNPEDPEFNFRLGVCMMYSEPENKSRPIFYFEEALKYHVEDVRIHYYLGRVFHNNYRFAEAQKSYTQYKELAKEKSVVSFDIDRRIEECKNGIALLSHIKLLYVIEKQLVKEETFYKSYNLNSRISKIIAVPIALLTKLDKKKNPPPFGLYVPEGNMLYFASYGDKGENGLDIYRSHQIPGGNWSESENLGNQINTKYDDAYPFITADGRTLYFSSKGHNSMGGYDVFKSEFSLSSFSWGECSNLNFPINTPFDDLFFVPDTNGAMAFFSSNRQSLEGKIYVYHIGLNKQTEEQDLAKIFREGGDASNLVNLLKDIADLKTNINISDYQKQIPKEEVQAQHSDDNTNTSIRKNDNAIVKIDIEDTQKLDKIIGNSYDAYRRIKKQAITIQNQKQAVGRIAINNDKLAAEYKSKGDQASISEARKYAKAASVAREIQTELDKQIIKTEATAKSILKESGYLQRYAGLHEKDSVQIVYARIGALENEVKDMPDIASEIVLKNQDILRNQRKAVSEKYNTLKDKDTEVKELNSEMQEYQAALNTINDPTEKQEYIDIIEAMKLEIAKKTAEKNNLALEYETLRNEADDLALANSKIDEVLNQVIASSQEFEKEGFSQENIEIIDEEIASTKKQTNEFILANEGTAMAIAANQDEEAIPEVTNNVTSPTIAVTPIVNENNVSENNNEAVSNSTSEQIATNQVEEVKPEVTYNVTSPTIAVVPIANENNVAENNNETVSDSTSEQIAKNQVEEAKPEVTKNVTSPTIAVAPIVKENNALENNNETVSDSTSDQIAINQVEEAKPKVTNNVTSPTIAVAPIVNENNALENNNETVSDSTSEQIASNQVEEAKHEVTNNVISPTIAVAPIVNENIASENNNETISDSTSEQIATNQVEEVKPEVTNDVTSPTIAVTPIVNENIVSENNNETVSDSTSAQLALNHKLEADKKAENEKILVTYRNQLDQIQKNIIENKNNLNSALEANQQSVNTLNSFVFNEYNISENKTIEANQLINNFKNSTDKAADLNRIKTLSKEAEEHRNVAIAGYEVLSGIESDNKDIEQSIVQLNELSKLNSASLNISNTDSFDVVFEQFNNTLSKLPKVRTNPTQQELAAIEQADSDNLNDIRNEIQYNENHINSLKTNKINSTNTNQIASIDKQILETQTKLDQLNIDEQSAIIKVNKSTAKLAVSKKFDEASQVADQNIGQVIPPEMIASIKSGNTSNLVSLEQEISQIELQLEPDSSEIQDISIADEQLTVYVEDSLYIPDFINSVQKTQVANEVLLPALTQLDNLEAKRESNQSEINKGLQSQQSYIILANELKDEMNSIKNQIESSNNTDVEFLIAQYSNKQEQYVAMQRKASAAAIYIDILSEENTKIDISSDEIEAEFKANRRNIAKGELGNTEIANLENSKTLTQENSSLNKYIEDLNNYNDLANSELNVVNLKIETNTTTYNQLLQKQDEINYRLAQETNNTARANLQNESSQIEQQVSEVKLELNNLENEALSLSLQIAKNNNIKESVLAQQEYIKSSETIAVYNSETNGIEDTISISNTIDTDIFNTQPKLNLQELVIAKKETTEKPNMPYYSANSVDLKLFDASEIYSVQRMLLINQNQLIEQEIDVLEGISYNLQDINQKEVYANQIADLEESKRQINSKVIELQQLIINSGNEIEDVSETNTADLIAKIDLQKSEYQEHIKLLEDTMEFYSEEEQGMIREIQNQLNASLDTLSIVKNELETFVRNNEYRKNKVEFISLSEKTEQNQFTNQAKLLNSNAEQNIQLANQSMESAQNPNITSEEKEQLIQQATQYENIALSQQNEALAILTNAQNIAATEVLETDTLQVTTEVVAIENLELVSEQNAVSIHDLDTLNNNIQVNNQEINIQTSEVAENNAVELPSSTNQTKTIDYQTVNIQELTLEELVLVDPTKLKNEDIETYTIRKAEIIGVFVGDARRGVSTMDFYNTNNPIANNPTLPSGLVYKVQIAAFRNPVPENTFGDIKPINAEQIPNSAYIRYVAGLFTNYSDANNSKNILVISGYKDAFVVAYFNGIRITNGEARKMIENGSAFTDVQLADNAKKLNIIAYQSASNQVDEVQKSNIEITATNSDLYYSVQVGVFGGMRTSDRLSNAPDLFYDNTANGYYRYFSGHYSNNEQANIARNAIRNSGIPDAFVVAFYKGSKVSISRARLIEQEITPATPAEVAVIQSNIVENKITVTNIVYKVQIGAFRTAREGAQLQILENISLNGLDTYNNANGLLVYTSNAYSSYADAQSARDQIRANGNTDVFVIAFENNVRISTTVARKKLGK